MTSGSVVPDAIVRNVGAPATGTAPAASQAQAAAQAAARSAGSPATNFACRSLDVMVAAVLLVALFPIMLVIALIIRAESVGAPIFRQQRLGRSLEPFTVYKFRSMRKGASSEVHQEYVKKLIAGDVPAPEVQGRKPQFKLTVDKRVTRVGRLLRCTSLDELPQLWNVLRGDMSLVGPRPSLQYEVDNYEPHWLTRCAVKPGMTGLWQVSGRSGLTIAQMVDLDLDYVQRRSLSLNVSILLRTIPVVLSRRGAS
jgi:lipopolysaccharide/colanic/teichoic acid biosynthesis glycosyltransferase